MTATYRPIRCPHGTELQPESAGFIHDFYEDGCRATSGIPVRFWCGRGEMLKPNGVSITEGEYLRDWAEALILNAGDDLYDEASRINVARKFEGKYPDGCVSAIDHAYCLAREDAPLCTFRGLISGAPCTLPADHDGVHSVWAAPDEPTEAALHLGEVPWSDRVDD